MGSDKVPLEGRGGEEGKGKHLDSQPVCDLLFFFLKVSWKSDGRSASF